MLSILSIMSTLLIRFFVILYYYNLLILLKLMPIKYYYLYILSHLFFKIYGFEWFIILIYYIYMFTKESSLKTWKNP